MSDPLEEKATSVRDSFALAQVEQLHVDALFGKKTHYNAADRLQRYHLRIGVPAAIMSTLLGTVLVGVAAAEWPKVVNWLGAIGAAIVAVLVVLQTFFNFERKAGQHRHIATRYLSVAKECDRLVAYSRDGAVAETALGEQLESLAKRCDEINTDAEDCPAKACDFQLARRGFGEGEESYTEQELQRNGD